MKKHIQNITYQSYPKECGIYIIEGKYVGRAEYPFDRVLNHVYLASKGRHHNKELQAIILNRLSEKQKVNIEFLPLPNCEQTEIDLICKLALDGVDLVNKKGNPAYHAKRFNEKWGKWRS